jgi:type I restriction enzyme S subunit
MSFTESLDVLVQQNANGLLGKASHWQRVALGNVSTILNGFPFASGNFTRNTGIPLLRIRDIQRDSTEAFFDGPVEDNCIVDPGDLVVGMDGDFNAALWKGPRAALNQRVCKIIPDDRFYSRRLLAFVLPGYLSTINGATSSITVKHLSS